MAKNKTINLLLLLSSFSVLFVVVATTTTAAQATATTTTTGDTTTTQQQIIIKDNIRQYSDFGEYTDPEYKKFYNPLNLFDNLVNTWSFWSQFGKSGFTVDLKNPIPQKICSAQVIAKNPQNAPFKFQIFGANKSLSSEGALDSAVEQINFDNDKCIEKANKVSMTFDATEKWTTLSEVKLFTNIQVPPVEPPICPPNSYWDPELQKCVLITPPIDNGTAIVNATLTLNVSNSTITINADETSRIIIPELTSSSSSSTTTTEEEEDEEDEDEDDKKKKQKEGDDNN